MRGPAVRTTAAVLALIGAGCGKQEPAAVGAETPEYRAWKGTQAIRQLPAAHFAETVSGTVLVHPPEQRSKSPDDFCDLYLNGQPVRRFRVGRMSNGRWPQGSSPLTIVAGAAWLDLWDSTSNRNYRFQVDTRQGTDYVFTPDGTGYGLSWSKREN